MAYKLLKYSFQGRTTLFDKQDGYAVVDHQRGNKNEQFIKFLIKLPKFLRWNVPLFREPVRDLFRPLKIETKWCIDLVVTPQHSSKDSSTTCTTHTVLLRHSSDSQDSSVPTCATHKTWVVLNRPLNPSVSQSTVCYANSNYTFSCRTFCHLL